MRFSASKNPPLSELAAAYGRGVLTPFTGAGISYPTCPLWLEFIQHLELIAGIGDARGTDSADLIRRASRASQALRHRGPTALIEAVATALYGNDRKPCGGIAAVPASRELARIWWPLVLTTNYDSLFLDAWNKRWVDESKPIPDPLPNFGRMLVVGRGRVDCQRILNSTRGPDNPLLWALQGFVEATGKRPLADQLTIGHEEYRRQTHEAVHFRRAFAEIYRSRTLLFVGSGLRESYLLDLFGETLELLGSIGHFHYALVPEGDVDPDFLQRRLQILPIEYPRDAHGHSVAAFLAQLKRAIDGPRPRTSRWTLKLGAASRTRLSDAQADIAVVRGELRKPGMKNVATAVGAGAGTTRPKIGENSMMLIRSFWPGAERNTLPLEEVDGTGVYRVTGYPLFVVVARDRERVGRDARDFREVAPSVRALMEIAAAEKFARIDVMLLAAGGKRTFPQHVSLREMVRGYCRWYVGVKEAERIPLWIYTKDARLLGLLESGRIDLASMTDSSRVRFWVEIQSETDSPAPILAIAKTSTTIKTIMEDYAIAGPHWLVSVRPAPTKYHQPRRAVDLSSGEKLDLAQFGVLNGSTIIFSRVAK